MGEPERRSDALPLGTVLKQRYIVDKVLGNGGFGITYLAWDKEAGRKVALKELYPRKDVYRKSDEVTVTVLSGQEDFFRELSKKFEDEAKLLMLLADGQSRIVRVYDLFYENNTTYYSMEYLEGYDLKTYMKQYGPMSWEMLSPMVYHVLLSLGRLHKQNLIHRDISPDNLFLTKDNKIYLIDFGSVRTYQGNQSFTVFIKQHFAPWEQYETNGRQGPWTDIYSFSVTMYMLLSGKLPPKAPDRKMGKKAVALETYCPNIPVHVARAIDKGMSVEIKDRFQSAEEFIQALRYAPQPASTLPQQPRQQVSPAGHANAPAPAPAPAQGLSMHWIYGCGGVYAGKRMRLYTNQVVTFGRQSSNNVVFPEVTVGVSRNQCALYVNQADDMFIKDNGSSYGTFLNEVRVGGNWMKVSSGSSIRFGNEVFQVK